MIALTTHKASWILLSASSTISLLLPLTKILTVLDYTVSPVNLTILLSSLKLTSSINLADPNFSEVN